MADTEGELDTQLVKHFHDLGFHPDVFGFIPEKEAAAALNMSQRKLADLRRENYFEQGETRYLAGKWRFSLRGLLRYGIVAL